jgi:hypothetical protein
MPDDAAHIPRSELAFILVIPRDPNDQPLVGDKPTHEIPAEPGDPRAQRDSHARVGCRRRQQVGRIERPPRHDNAVKCCG